MDSSAAVAIMSRGKRAVSDEDVRGNCEYKLNAAKTLYTVMLSPRWLAVTCRTWQVVVSVSLTSRRVRAVTWHVCVCVRGGGVCLFVGQSGVVITSVCLSDGLHECGCCACARDECLHALSSHSTAPIPTATKTPTRHRRLARHVSIHH